MVGDAAQGAARIFVCGFDVECHPRAAALTREDFARDMLLEGAALSDYAHSDPAFGFGRQMDMLRPWRCVPGVLGKSESGGPVRHSDFDDMVGALMAALEHAKPLDGVYIEAHGAAATTEVADAEGYYFSKIRALVGNETPIVATLDLHGNVSEAMFSSADVLISYRRNPHADILERARDAADSLHELMNGRKAHTAFVRLPLVTPQITQSTDEGTPFGDCVRYAEACMGDDLFNVSLLPGFGFSDTPDNGFAVMTASWAGREHAAALATDIAERAWGHRARYGTASLLTIEDAVQKAETVTQDASPIILADIGDNPGGGGAGRTIDLLSALLASSADNVLLGVFYAPELVSLAFATGLGGKLKTVLPPSPCDQRETALPIRATVICLRENAQFRGCYGMASLRDAQLGQACCLEIGGIRVIVSSQRAQILSADYFTFFDLDPAKAKTIVVKSRGHFRAGFAHIAPDTRIFEVNTPGLTTADLRSITWKGLRRPVYPIDADAVWPRADFPSLFATRSSANKRPQDFRKERVAQ